MSQSNTFQRCCNNFENSKNQCLGKRDKSFAGRIDPKAVEICAVINEREEFYTTSSCAGRCYLYKGLGVKATTDFERFRISHDRIQDPSRYFDLSTIDLDPTGGGDPIRTVGQFDHPTLVRQLQETLNEREIEKPADEHGHVETSTGTSATDETEDQTIWLRFEPFILHVACRAFSDASSLMTAARPSFKNVGLTTWKNSRYLVAIWGDEGLDMPLTGPDGKALFLDNAQWLADLVNQRHDRNWSKIYRFVQAVRMMPPWCEVVDENDGLVSKVATRIPRSYDVVGDVALLHALADDIDEAEVGEAIMGRNKAIKLVVIRVSNLGGTERAPGTAGLKVIAGTPRSPIITTHSEHGIRCVVDLETTFFSPRMGPERLRICQQVARGENVMVLFAGVGMEALQIAGRTEAKSVVAIELNPNAVECARRGHRMLSRNKAVKCLGAADRIEIVEGDALELLGTLERNSFDRVLAPRPKEGALDGDLGKGDGGIDFLKALLPIMKQDGGECHWYDFVADHEFPACARTRSMIENICSQCGLSMDVLHIASVGSVAMRQLRVCVDFRIVRMDPPLNTVGEEDM